MRLRIALLGIACSLPLMSAGDATVRRDVYGVPHILAKDEYAAAFAHGYVTAEDHFEELSRLFLRARAEQASVFGDKYRLEDQMVRQLGIRDIAEAAFPKLPPNIRGILDEYAAGYNAYLKERKAPSPAWVRPVTGIDVFAHCRAVLLLDFALDRRQLRLATTPNPPGSNMWALGRGHTASGRGILLANPHLEWKGSQLFHEVHIRVPGVIDVYGAALIGSPVVTIGFNANLGWTHTVNSIDADDVYELTLDPADASHYLYDGRSLPFRKTSSGMWSHYGPVLRVEGQKAYALKSSNLDDADFLLQWNLMAKAKNLAEFRQALNVQGLPMFNIGYTDHEGNVMYLYGGRIPSRPEGYDWSGIVPGNTSKTEWSTIHPISELPFLLNPEGGYIQNSNDPPWLANRRHPLNPGDFPEYMRAGKIGLRAQQSLRLIEASDHMSLEDVKRAKVDYTVPIAQRLKVDLVNAAEKSPQPELREAAAVLAQWDDHAGPTSIGSALFVKWWNLYLGVAKPLYRKEWSMSSPLESPSGLGDPVHALDALSQASKELVADFGSVRVPWGEVFRMRKGDRDLPVGGAPLTTGSFRALAYEPAERGREVAQYGDSFVVAVEFTSPPSAFSVLAYSEASEKSSKHYADQSELFARGEWKPVWFSEEEIQKHLEREYRPGHDR